MQHFIKSFVVPVMTSRKWNRVCEIGSSRGGAIELLRGIPGLEVTIIDPCLDCDLRQKFSGDVSIEVMKGLSLEVLPGLSKPFDCILIDGDHNWYTVYNELRVIAGKNLLRRGGLVFFHDVCWPWGRRDMYYQPETIPLEFRREYGGAGDNFGDDRLSDIRDIQVALREGGERNGVLTAIEDFLQDNKGMYRFYRVNVGLGLGVMQLRGELSDHLSFLALACKGFVVSLAYQTMKLAGVRDPSEAVRKRQRPRPATGG